MARITQPDRELLTTLAQVGQHVHFIKALENERDHWRDQTRDLAEGSPQISSARAKWATYDTLLLTIRSAQDKLK